MASSNDFSEMETDLEDAWLRAQGIETETERSDQAHYEAAKELETAKPRAELVDPDLVEDKSAKDNRLLSQLDELAPGIVTTAKKLAKEAFTQKLSAQPVMRATGQLYHPRNFAGKVDIEVVQDLRSRKIPLLLAGYPGCGKTSLAEAAFAYEGGPITIAGHGEMEMGEIIGRYVVRPAQPGESGNKYEWVDGPLIEAMKTGRVLFVDDITLIPTGVLARLYPVMDGRGFITVDEHEGERIDAKEGFYLLGAHNPGVPGAVLSEALSSRFSLHVDVPTDFDLAIELGVDREVVNLAKQLTTKRDDDQKDGVAWAPAMRELLAYKAIKETLGKQAALRNLISVCPDDISREQVAIALGGKVDVAKPLALGDRIK